MKRVSLEGSFAMRVASNCPADGFTAGEEFPSGAPLLLAVQGEALRICRFRLFLGKILEIFCSQRQGSIYVLLGASSSECFTLAGLQYTKR